MLAPPAASRLWGPPSPLIARLALQTPACGCSLASHPRVPVCPCACVSLQVDMDECITLLWARYGKELVEENLTDMKKENHPSLQADAANEKNVSFSFFYEIQRRCKKMRIGSGIKSGSTTVPNVNGLKFVSDPKMQHLM